MKHVTFTRDMKPYRARDGALLPDAIAAALAAAGVIEPDPPDWPQRPLVAAPPAPIPARKQKYRTK